MSGSHEDKTTSELTSEQKKILVDFLNKKVSRRRAISTSGKAVVAGVVGLAIGGAAGYLLKPSGAATPSIQTVNSTQTISQSASTSSAGLKQGTGTLTIGRSVPTSGPTAPADSKEVDMLNKWADMINARGGIYAEKMGGYIPVKSVVLQDNGPADLATVKANYTKLASQYNVDIMIGPFTAAPSEAASAVAIQNGIPYIDNQAEEIPIYTQPGASDWVVAALNLINYWFWNYLNVLKSQTSAKTLAFIDQGDDFGIETNGTGPSKFGGIQFAKLLGFNVLAADTVNTGFAPNYDYTSEVQKMKSLDPDVILYSEPAGVFQALFWQACKNAGYHPRAYHADFGALKAFQGVTGPALGTGITADVYWDSSLPYEGLWGKTFWQELQNNAGFTDADWSWLSIGYSCLEIASYAVMTAGTTEKASVMNQLKKMSFTNLLGPWRAQNPLADPFPPTQGVNTGVGMALSRAIPVQIINGKRTIIGPPEIATGKYIYPEPFSF